MQHLQEEIGREGGRERVSEREGGRKAWRAIESEGERVRALLDG